MKSVTMKEIGDLAGVSPTTVSLVVNDKPGVSDSKRAEIKKLLTEHGYRASGTGAGNTANGDSRISVVFNTSQYALRGFQFFDLLSGILEESTKNGLSVTFSGCPKDSSILKLPALSPNVVGYIVLQDPDPQNLGELLRMGKPFVVADSHNPSTNYSKVRGDYFSASYKAIEYLIEKGHRNIGFIGSESQVYFHMESYSAFRSTMANHGLPIVKEWIRTKATNIEDAEQMFASIMQNPADITAVFCAGDIYAIGAVRAAYRMGIRIPDDISVIAVDDINVSNLISPSLTTVRVNEYEIGAESVRLLLRTRKSMSPVAVSVASGAVIERETVASIQDK